MPNAWEDIGPIEPELKSPADTISDLFFPLLAATKNAVGYRLQQVNFFPEEVTYTSPMNESMQLLGAQITGMLKENEHPNFGYDISDKFINEYIRYRLLLYPDRKRNYEFELLKFKFPLIFYPVQIYIDAEEFPELASYFIDAKLLINNKDDLENIINRIIKAKSTLILIRRLMML